MNTRNHLMPGLLASLMLAGVVGCGKPMPPATGLLAGHWEGVEVGQPAGRYAITITANELEYRGAQSNDWCRGTFVLNESAQPMPMDLVIHASPGAAGKTMLLICELRGDELKVAGAQPGNPKRPADFSTNQQTRIWSFLRKP